MTYEANIPNKERRVIHIEICEGFAKEKWHLRIGDISGSSETSNATKEEVLEEIKEEMEE